MHEKDKAVDVMDDIWIESIAEKIEKDPELKGRLMDKLSKIKKSEDQNVFNKILGGDNDLKKVINAD